MEKTKKKNQSILKLTECAVMLALATVLSIIKVWTMPAGGSITLCSMLPIMLIAIKYGNLTGLATGFLYSLIQLFMDIAGGSVFMYCETAKTTALVVAFDYIVPFTVLGLAGLLKKISPKKIPMLGCYLGIIMSVAIRFACHFITGFSIWGQWAEEGQSKYVYSLIYNGTYLLPELAITLVVAVILLQIPHIRNLLKIRVPVKESEKTE